MATAQSEQNNTPRISLRVRLTSWVVAIFVFIQAITGVGLWLYQRSATLELFEQRLFERASSLASMVESRLPGLSRAELTSIAHRELAFLQFERFEVDVVGRDGNSLVSPQTRWPATSRALADRAIETGLAQRSGLQDDEAEFAMPEGHTAAVIAVPIRLGSGLPAALVIVTSDAFVVRQTALVTRVLLLGGFLGVIASALSGWYIAGIAVEPIRRLSLVAGQLGPETIDRELVVESSNSEIAELTSEIDAARARMREAFAAQERFLSNISHEIKTPIATLLTEAQTINRSILPDHARDFVEIAEEEMRKLGSLVESFLTLTRVRDGGGIQNLRACPANEIVMESIEDCSAMAARHDVRLEPRLAEGEDAMNACIAGDQSLLRTMLNNLVRNAIRFTRAGGRVGVSAMIGDGLFTVRVSDQGPGLPPDLIEKLFDRFTQSAEELRRHRGHGLGLAIAKGIAELHKGDITARNLPDGGAEFEVSLPVAPEPAEEKPCA